MSGAVTMFGLRRNDEVDLLSLRLALSEWPCLRLVFCDAVHVQWESILAEFARPASECQGLLLFFFGKMMLT